MVRTISVALVCLFVPSIPLSQPAATQPKFKAGVTLIEVAASVRDGAGRFVPGLARKDFELKVDGRSVPIDSFAAVSAAPTRAEEGRFIVVLFDDLVTSPTLLTRMREIAVNVIDRMGPYDEAAVLAANGDSMTSTGNRDEVKARIKRLQPFDKLQPMLGTTAEQALRAIADLSTEMASVQRRRKIMVVVGSSGLFDMTRPSPQARARLEQAWFDAARAAARSNVSVYIIDPRGLSQPDQQAASISADAPGPSPWLLAQGGGFSGASGFAGETGGLAFTNTNNFNLAVDRIWSDIGNYYLLGYGAAEGKADKAPKLSVHVKRAGVEVQARRTAG